MHFNSWNILLEWNNSLCSSFYNIEYDSFMVQEKMPIDYGIEFEKLKQIRELERCISS